MGKAIPEKTEMIQAAKEKTISDQEEKNQLQAPDAEGVKAFDPVLKKQKLNT